MTTVITVRKRNATSFTLVVRRGAVKVVGDSPTMITTTLSVVKQFSVLTRRRPRMMQLALAWWPIS
jgi:hypothetical protein